MIKLEVQIILVIWRNSLRSTRRNSIKKSTINICTNIKKRVTDSMNAFKKEKGENLKAAVACEPSHLSNRILWVMNDLVRTV